MDIITKFEEKVIECEDTGCHLWAGALKTDGYGKLAIDRKHVGAHRIAYALFVGELTKGLVIDHLCHNRCCVNPDHLELVTDAENIKRGHTLRKPKSSCKRGHRFTEENTRVYRGNRHCRTCDRMRKRIAKNGNTR